MRSGHAVLFLREWYTLAQDAKRKVSINASELTSLDRPIRLL